MVVYGGYGVVPETSVWSSISENNIEYMDSFDKNEATYLSAMCL